MTEREQFETWAKAPPHHKSCRVYPYQDSEWAGQYYDVATQLAWEAWQAARGQWLPIETKPKDDGSYLVADATRGLVAPYIRGVIHNNVGTCWDWQYGEAITHWMPLPAPPQTTEKE